MVEIKNNTRKQTYQQTSHDILNELNAEEQAASDPEQDEQR
ncbi:hypothetical protein [Staphylococcus aureus]|nr:hypothetical protein [Staphylococcus aureus]